MAEPILALTALALITIALIGQGIEMRKIRIRTYVRMELDIQTYSWTKKM